MQYTVLDQIGDYVVYARLGGECGPFFVRMAGDEMPLSTHWTKADARKAARRYMAADKRRQRQKSLARSGDMS